MKIHTIIFAIVISTLAFFSKPARAATLLVTNTADSGPWSLRAQIAAAQPGDTVVCTNLAFQNLTLTSGQIVISNSSLTIQGGQLFVSGNNASRIFLITSNSTVNLISIFMINGKVIGDSGGAIRNDGTLTVTSCSFLSDTAIGGDGFSGNLVQNGGSGGGGAGMGGAIFSDGPSLSMIGCGFLNDMAQGGNGAAGNTKGVGGAIGGFGGGPNGATFTVTPISYNGGFGGGGSGGWAVPGAGFNAGNGGFGGGGGGGGGASPNPGGGTGGAGGLYGGAGGTAMSYSGGGGGGAGVGGAVFTLGGTATITLCNFQQNLATNGIGGTNAANGQGVGASLFLYGTAVTAVSNTFSGDVASSSPTGDVIVSVMNTNDSGPGSLRDTIAGLPTSATITFNPSLAGKTITLAGGQIMLTNNLVIDASALPGGVAVVGNGSSRLFQVGPNAAVTLNFLTLVDGNAATNSGGAIYSDGALTALNCSFSNNVASGGLGLTSTKGNAGGGGGGAGLGGAIFSDGPSLILGGCVFNNNSVQGGDGAFSFFGTTPAGLGGKGGGPNGGVRGANLNATGTGGGGCGGDGGSGVFNGGNGGFGGGGGGGGGNTGSTVGSGGLGGSFGGNGGNASVGSGAGGGGGGGGAGLGGAIFSLNGLTVITNCSFTGNAAANGQGGFGGVTGMDGGNGQAMGAAIFACGPALVLNGNVFHGNIAAPGPYATLALGVFTGNDSGAGSLRSMMTNIVDGLTTIVFTPGLSGQTIALSTGPLLITNNLVIDASGLPSGPGPTVKNASASSRIFTVASGITVTLDNLTLSSGAGTGDGGGAVHNDGSLTAINCIFQGNTAHGGDGQTPGTAGGGGGGGAGMGGAIYSDGPMLTLNGCTFINNRAQGGTGGNGNGFAPNGYAFAGNGGGPNGGLGGFGTVGSPGGFGGGGGGGENETQQFTSAYSGGVGGFGGGGGGAGAGVNTPPGGRGGTFGGSGGQYPSSQASYGGGGGAGLGGAIFTLNGAVAISGCLFTNNSATNGLGGAFNGANGQGWGGALFMIGGNLALNGNSFINNSAVTAAPDQFTESDTLSFTTVGQKLQVSWPTNAIGYHVQYTTNLASPIVWQALSGSVSNNGTSFQQSLTNVTTKSAFFRLSPVAP